MGFERALILLLLIVLLVLIVLYLEALHGKVMNESEARLYKQLLNSTRSELGSLQCSWQDVWQDNKRLYERLAQPGDTDEQ